jgi:hypothetical protein
MRLREARTANNLSIRSPAASGKSRALMFIALDKMHEQGVKKRSSSWALMLDRRRLRARAIFAERGIMRFRDIGTSVTKPSSLHWQRTDRRVRAKPPANPEPRR